MIIRHIYLEEYMQNIVLSFLAADTVATQGVGQIISLFAMPVLILVVFYFMLIRPQRKQEKKQRDMRSALKSGDKVITTGGVTGRVVNIKDDEVTIETSVARTMVTFRREAIMSVIKPISDET